jgi:hypothetical protein
MLFWEALHFSRANAFLALGNEPDAVVSVRAGLARVAYTLEGADEDFRAAVEANVDVVKRLRALARRLGVADEQPRAGSKDVAEQAR